VKFSGVYVTIECPSVHLSHRLTAASAIQYAAGLLLSRRLISTAGAVLSSTCGQRHVESQGMRLNKGLLETGLISEVIKKTLSSGDHVAMMSTV